MLSFPGPLWPRLVAREMVLSMDEIELFDIYTLGKEMTNAKLFEIKLLDHLSECKQMTYVK